MMHSLVWPSSAGQTVVDLARLVKIPQLAVLGTRRTADKMGTLGTTRQMVLGNNLIKSSANALHFGRPKGAADYRSECDCSARGALLLGCFTASGCLILLF